MKRRSTRTGSSTQASPTQPKKLRATSVSTQKSNQHPKCSKDASTHVQTLTESDFVSNEKASKLQSDQWQQEFDLLRTFQRKNGHCQVPEDFVVDSVNLGEWVKRHRYFYINYMEGKPGANAYIDDKRIANLNSIGFEWREADSISIEEEEWRECFELLCHYYREHGFCFVPHDFVVDGVKLGEWVKSQKKFYNNFVEGKVGECSSLTYERIAKLESIQFKPRYARRQVTTVDDGWKRKFQLVREFQREHGHCRVPNSLVVDSIKLGQWVISQRYLYKVQSEGKTRGGVSISADRIVQLNSIGFEWTEPEQTNPKQTNPKQTNPKQITPVISDEDRWQAKYDLLCAFHRKNGHCRVPGHFSVGAVKLGKWVSYQRTHYRKRPNGKTGTGASVSKKRIAKLNAIGFEWKVIGGEWNDDEGWQYKYDLLCAFHRENGHCRVPVHFSVGAVKLGKWVSNQKTFYKNRMAGKTGAGASISKERIAKLNEIGFEWK